MKGDFIAKFVKEIFEFTNDLSRELNKIPYKGFRYSNFDRYGYSHKKTYSGFKNLENRGLLQHTGEDSFKFTKEGVLWLNLAAFRYFRNRYPKWDKKWRLVIFDIPGSLNAKRDSLRRKLKHIGFLMIQRSVFAFPYPCEEELSDICRKLKISDYVDMVVAESIGSREEELVKLFNLVGDYKSKKIKI
ncbi:MAG: CRISPR-associated endonuclease Cas2 [Candidatus Yanofskybacteria bacterium]|nr:CRISPR-associated endonuclease Cas2 [Candidatus Yanofskybacteria bacterium]